MGKKIPSKKIQCQMQKAENQFQEMMKLDGFGIHLVTGDSAHTHGLREHFNHPEIECVLHTSPQLLVDLVHGLGMRVRAGVRFSADDMITDIFHDVAVKLVACADGLRLIIPDSKGELDRDRMEPAYAKQYDGLDVSREELMEAPSSDPKFRN